VAIASADGVPYLVPLSFDWDGEALLMATPTDCPTGRNLAATRAVRMGWAIPATCPRSRAKSRSRSSRSTRCSRSGGDRFAARTGFDPLALATPNHYRWFRISPLRVQAWREVNEMLDRDLMRDGR
jgi:hypothetical protein